MFLNVLNIGLAVVHLLFSNILRRGSLGFFRGGGAGEQARAMNILEDWGREMRARGDLWEALSFSPSLSCTSCTCPTQTAMLQ